MTGGHWYINVLPLVELIIVILCHLISWMQESYVVLEKAIRSLASFYSKAGPSATLPEEIKSEILSDLNKAEELL